MYLELKEHGEVIQDPVSPTFPALKPWQTILLYAADTIERKGWCQRHLIDVKGRICAIGAINEAWYLAQTFDMGEVVLAQEKLQKVVGPIVEWNDAKGRTKSQVVETLRYVAGHASSL